MTPHYNTKSLFSLFVIQECRGSVSAGCQRDPLPCTFRWIQRQREVHVHCLSEASCVPGSHQAHNKSSTLTCEFKWMTTMYNGIDAKVRACGLSRMGERPMALEQHHPLQMVCNRDVHEDPKVIPPSPDHSQVVSAWPSHPTSSALSCGRASFCYQMKYVNTKRHSNRAFFRPEVEGLALQHASVCPTKRAPR